MPLPEHYLRALADSIADGTRVDWAEAQSKAASEDDRGLLQRLQALATLAAVHRGTGTPDPEAETGGYGPESWPSHPRSFQRGRFLVQGQLGKGGFGVVYHGYDRERKVDVAIKSLHHLDVSSVYDLKKEFRALADVSHPNLVTLYDLFGDADQWFIVMELVKGTDFLSYVQRKGEARSSERSGSRGGVACDFERLERALWQLAHALHYLHGHGTLHRDIKPPNVLVTRDGQVKVLDFGLATDATVDPAGDTVRFRGTPGYVAPEQAGGEPASEASDWYSVGVMLFEAIAGQRPFTGTQAEVLAAKQREQAPSLGKICPGVPSELELLCRRLLSRDPAARPAGQEVLTGLQRIWPAARARVRSSTRASAPGFVGRTAQLGTLHDAFEASRSGRAQAVYVHGDSGMGKTALVHHFLNELRQRTRGTVILEGRCYERESVPYKGLDNLVDGLSRYLRKLAPSEVAALLPRDLSALTRLFPILSRVETVVDLQRRATRVSNAQELRRRGFAAFRELLARLSDRHAVTLVIDDLQWGDADSADLITSLLRADEPPPLLFIACYRSQDIDSNPALQSLVSLSRQAAELPQIDVHEIVVNQLEKSEAEELATSLSRTYGGLAPIATIVRESGRSPFFISELVQYAATTPGAVELSTTAELPSGVTGGDLTLERVIQARAGRLGDGARRLLHVLALIGRPVKLALASEIAELGQAAVDDVIELRSAHLTRTRVALAGEEIELYHDRVREAIASQIPELALKLLHSRIAGVLESSSDADPETLRLHFNAAGDSRRASMYAVLAADRARDALAFDRAARRYTLALDYEGLDPRQRREIQIKLGDALAAGGRGQPAARAYLAAAPGALAADELELKRRAAEQLLRSGHIDEGMRVLNDVLTALHMQLPATPGRALVSLALRRVFIRMRGVRFQERDRSQVSAAELVRVDTCWSVATVMGVVDTIRGADFQARHLMLALKVGEPFRMARALAVEIAYTALGGGRTRARQQRLTTVAEALVNSLAQPEAAALLMLAKGTAAFFRGEWQPAHELFAKGEPLLRECAGVTWELDTAHLYDVLAMFYLGEVKELSARLPGILQEARERDDLTAETNLRTRTTYIAQLADDRPDQASNEVEQGMAGWAHPGFHAQHSWELYARTEIDLYEGEGGRAWQRVREHWTPLRRSMLLRIQAVRIESVYLRSRSALAAAVDAKHPGERAALLKSATRDAARLQREGDGWAVALAVLLRGATESIAGNRERAIGHLRTAEASFRRLDMRLHAAVALRRRGQLVGGREGESCMQLADAWMTGQAIKNPARMTAMLAPGVFAGEPSDGERASLGRG